MDLGLEKKAVTTAHLVQRLILFAVSFHCETMVKNDFAVKLKIFQEKTFLFAGECF